jgi:hypothetical protein
LITWAFSSSANCSAFARVKLLQKAAVSPDVAAGQQARRARNFASGAIPGDSYAIVRTRDDDAGDRGPVPFGDIAATVHEVTRHGHSSSQIGIADVDAGVDLGHADAPSRRDLVQLVQAPKLGTRLQRVQRIVVRQHMEQLHRLCRFDARIQRQFLHDLSERHIARSLHDETVDT